MQANKLIQILGSFTKIEGNRFRKFLCSPYHNDQEEYLVLFEALHSLLLKNQSIPEKAALWKIVFPKKSYKDIHFRHLMSGLNQKALEFLVLEQKKTRGVHGDIDVLDVLNNRNLNKHFIGKERHYRKSLADNGFRDPAFFLSSFKIAYLKRVFIEKSGVNRTVHVNLGEMDFNLDCFYLLHKLKHYCDAINYQNFLKVEIEINMIEELKAFLKESIYLEVPSILIYYQVMLTLLEPEEESHFQDLKTSLEEHGDLFPPEDLDTLYIFAQNYCVIKINSGKSAYFKELLDIYKALIQKGVLLKNNELAPSHYKNIVTVGLRVQEEFDWVESFLHEYNKYLPVSHQKEGLGYNLAQLYFAQGKYKEVIGQIHGIEYNDIFYALSARWILVKTYFELEEIDPLDALLDSFRIFLRRNNMIAKSMKQRYSHMIRVVKKIIRLRYGDKAAKEALNQEISTSKTVADKAWLLGKIK